MGPAARRRLRRRVADVCDYPNAVHDRNIIAAAVIDACLRACAEFAHVGFAGFMPRWARYDVLVGRRVRLKRGNGIAPDIAQGAVRACGVNERGMLVVEDETGARAYAHGEVSIDDSFGDLSGGF